MIIYKYLDEKGAKAVLGNNSVLMKSALDYNDPYDSIFYIDEKEKQKAYKLFLNYWVFKEFLNVFVNQNTKPVKNVLYAKILIKNAKLAEKRIKRKNVYKSQIDFELYRFLLSKIININEDELKKQFDSIIDDVLLKIRKSFLLSCFSLKRESLLMWSHYAENNSSVCIEYDLDSDHLRKVLYQKRIPIFKLSKVLEVVLGHEISGKEIDFNDKSLDFIIKPILTKHNVWSYENEIRLIISSKDETQFFYEDGEKKLFKMPKPKRVYIGCKANQSFIKEIEEICSNEVEIVKANVSIDNKGKLSISYS